MSKTVTPAMAIAITNWDSLFEVDDKGAAWKDGKPFRKGPLNYLRVPTSGTFARRKQALYRHAGADGPAVFAVLFDIAEQQAGLDRPLREGGVLRTLDGEPATADDIADQIGRDRAEFARHLDYLLDRRVGLLKKVDLAQIEAPLDDVPGDSEESPGNPRPLSDQGPGDSGAETAQSKAIHHKTKQSRKCLAFSFRPCCCLL